MTCGAATGETAPDLVTPKVTRLLTLGGMEKITGNQTQTGAQSIRHGGTQERKINKMSMAIEMQGSRSTEHTGPLSFVFNALYNTI